MPMVEAICTKIMRCFGSAHGFFLRISENSVSDAGKFIALLLSIPCFKASHFFFKIAYSLQQHKLLRLCREDFPLEVYSRSIAGGSVVDILQSLRHIKHGLEGVKTHYEFTGHLQSPLK